MRFSAVPGLEETKDILRQSVQRQHIAHAQLFMGKEGSANLALALAYATYVNCTQRTETDSCGACPSCKKYDKLIHPDLNFIFPTSTTPKITKRDEAISQNFLKEWRAFVLDNPYQNVVQWSSAFGGEGKQCMIPKEESRQIVKSLSLKAFEAEYKVMLIWLPETMHSATANAILKILEEPPAKTLFFLVANEPEKLLTTILSRTQVVQVRGFSDTELTHFLTAQGVEANRAAEVAYLAEGNLLEAQRLSTEVEDGNQAQFRDWMRECFKFDFEAIYKRMEAFGRLGKEAQKGLLQFGLNMFREALVFQYAGESLNRLEGKQLDFVQNFSKVVNENNISGLVQLFNDAFYHLERNANPKITFLDLSLKARQLFKVK